MSRCALVNSGNTCFLNTAVQILAHTAPLVEFLDRGVGHANPQLADSVLLHEFNALRQTMLRGPIVNPHRFIKAVQLVAKFKRFDMNPSEQNDVAEFVLFLLDCFHNAVLRPNPVDPYRGPQMDLQTAACRTAVEQKWATDYSELVDIFNGIHLTTIVSARNTMSHKADPYLMLDLPIGGPTLHHCLDAFLATEHIDDWHNDATGRKEPAEKHSALWSLPPILIIVLKRFCPLTRRKDDRYIAFPLDHLDMRPYVPDAPRYECYAVANHMGSATMGHYSAIVRPIGVTSWLSYDDAAIRPIVNTESIVTPYAYCLFYRRKGA